MTSFEAARAILLGGLAGTIISALSRLRVAQAIVISASAAIGFLAVVWLQPAAWSAIEQLEWMDGPMPIVLTAIQFLLALALALMLVSLVFRHV